MYVNVSVKLKKKKPHQDCTEAQKKNKHHDKQPKHSQTRSTFVSDIFVWPLAEEVSGELPPIFGEIT